MSISLPIQAQTHRNDTGFALYHLYYLHMPLKHSPNLTPAYSAITTCPPHTASRYLPTPLHACHALSLTSDPCLLLPIPTLPGPPEKPPLHSCNSHKMRYNGPDTPKQPNVPLLDRDPNSRAAPSAPTAGPPTLAQGLPQPGRPFERLQPGGPHTSLGEN